MSQRAAFKKALGLADEQITAYSVLQPTMRLDFINRIMEALTADSEVNFEE
jgi:GTP-binding protein